MNIKFIDILNFRKLKKCRIDLSPKETLFVGANNSGKTSAMDALIYSLKQNPDLQRGILHFQIGRILIQ